MLTREEKKHIHQLLKTNNIKGKGIVFNMIERGSSLVEVENFIDVLIAEQEKSRKKPFVLNDTPVQYNVFGRSLIAQNAIDSMDIMMRLPSVTGGVAMSDCHFVGDNIVPVGGVVKSRMIFPDIVSNDIACSVLLTVTSMPVDDVWFNEAIPSIKYVLRDYSYFGQEMNPFPVVFEQDFFKQELDLQTSFAKELYGRIKHVARNQFGTSGDGNHFLEVGTVNVQGSSFHNTGKKRYLAVLSHFGSRGVGADIANAYSRLAAEQYEMPKNMGNAPLDPETPEGQDYWTLMNWAGEFAEAGHRWLHKQILQEIDDRKSLSYRDEQTIYTKHNFAWKTDDGEFIHRKGATPAEAGQYGVIPATMGDETQIVIGLGNPESLNSASHGAGRKFSRGAALQQFGNEKTADVLLRDYGVHLIGGGADEDPRAYKKISEVMKAQEDCVTSLGTFRPKVVRMADPRFDWKRK